MHLLSPVLFHNIFITHLQSLYIIIVMWVYAAVWGSLCTVCCLFFFRRRLLFVDIWNGDVSYMWPFLSVLMFYCFIDNVTCLQSLPCVQIIEQVSVRSMYRLNHKLLSKCFFFCFSFKMKIKKKQQKKTILKKPCFGFLRDICLF